MGYGINFEKPRNLTEEEWDRAAHTLRAVPHLRRAVDILRESSNEPTSARVLLPQKLINQGNEYHNNYFRKAKVPLRLTRVGNWGMSQPHRPDRLLALVPWNSDRGRPVAPTSADARPTL